MPGGFTPYTWNDENEQREVDVLSNIGAISRTVTHLLSNGEMLCTLSKPTRCAGNAHRPDAL